ncbi:hypothetical protein GCM10018771_34900 [Streptomyces cellulosae]|nr:hypothetical protein GCM10018771_34900 [Streptomyces cellulosae]
MTTQTAMMPTTIMKSSRVAVGPWAADRAVRATSRSPSRREHASGSGAASAAPGAARMWLVAQFTAPLKGADATAAQSAPPPLPPWLRAVVPPPVPQKPGRCRLTVTPM